MNNLTLNIALTLLNVFFATSVTFGQGNIQGIVKDSLSDEKLSFASIALKQNDRIIMSTITDAEGNFFIDHISKGEYSLVLSYVGKLKEFTTIIVNKGSSSYTLAIDLTNEMPEMKVAGHKNLISPEEIKLYEADFIANIGAINITDIESIGAAKVETPNGISYKGARPGTSVYYIDGMRTYGELYLPMSAVESVVVYNSGIPAHYGNTTGAVVVVETKSWLEKY
jgi:hypothetical protein